MRTRRSTTSSISAPQPAAGARLRQLTEERRLKRLGNAGTLIQTTKPQPLFATEDEAKAHFEKIMSPYYRLYSEVRLVHDNGSHLRIDYVGVPNHNYPVELRAEIIGFEIKRSFLSPSSFAQPFIRTLQQAIDYRHCRIADQRSRRRWHQRLPFVLIFPDYRELRTVGSGNAMEQRSDWIWGVIRLAGRYNVGFVREQRSWSGEDFVAFEVADTTIWRSHMGIVNGEAFGSNRKRGSQ